MNKLLLVVALLPGLLPGAVALLLHESTGTGAARFTDAGHAAVYLSQVCAESALRLRLCRPGEPGAVLSSHPNIGESEVHEWNAAPLPVYLYGVERAEDAPLFATPALRRVLQERYRQRSLSGICPQACAEGDGRWRDMAGQLFMRDIYALRVETTEEQDEEFVRDFNALPNAGTYNGFTNNCADFVRNILNRFFPGSAKPDHVNDFGMTSPKAISKSFTHFGQRHPELSFTIEKFVQLDGSIRRSLDNRKGTEVSFRSKKWLFPLLLRPYELTAFVTSYSATGRFNPEGEFRRGSPGGEEIWEHYRALFVPVFRRAIAGELFRSERDLGGFFGQLEAMGTPQLTAEGIPYLQVNQQRLYLTRDTVLGGQSDRALAQRLLLAKVHQALNAPAKNRDSITAFEQTWKLMMKALESDAVILEVSPSSERTY